MNSDQRRLNKLWKQYHLEPPTDWFRFSQCSDGTLLLDYREHFAFHINATSAHIETYSLTNARQPQIDVYMQTQLHGLQLTLRGQEPLHASVLSANGLSFALLADSGQGKSTLAAALRAMGATLISDDLLVHQQHSHGVQIDPADPLYLKLFPEAWRRWASDLTAIDNLNSHTSKKIFALTPCLAPPQLKVVYVLGQSAQVSLEPMSKLEAYLAAAENTFTTVWWPERRARDQFAKLNALTQSVRFFKFSYPREWERLEEVSVALLNHVGSVAALGASLPHDL